MIVTLSGTPGSGKSAVARRLAVRLGVPHYSMGDLRRRAAAERGITLEQMNELAAQDTAIEHATDAVQQELAASGRAFVIDGRLSHHFIPRALTVFLTCAPDEAARRVRGAIVRGERTTEGAAADTLSIKSRLMDRLNRDRERLMRVYGLRDPFDPAQFDLVIDTTHRSIEQIVERIVEELQKGARGVGS